MGNKFFFLKKTIAPPQTLMVSPLLGTIPKGQCDPAISDSQLEIL
jgi:hypothetical protein